MSESKPMAWSELRERVNDLRALLRAGMIHEARATATSVLADIDAAAEAMEQQERDAEWARCMRSPKRDVKEFYRD